MKIIARLGIGLASILFLGLASVPALADDGVARISVTNGNITLQHGDNGDTEAAVVNTPVSVGDYLSTASGSHAEVQLDNNDFIRLGSDAQMRFAKLDPSDHQLQLAAGTAELRILGNTNAGVQLDTPSITIRPDEPGAYRVTVDNNGTTVFTVRSGQADLLGPQGAQTIDSGTSVQISGSSSNPQVSTIETVAYDGFDSWNSQRDSYEAAASSPYVNSDIVGVDDLGTYGHWVYASDYGNVWVPYDEGPEWAPYQDGRWVWEPYYGWTWVGYEPWGWAPYHYGRWFYDAGYGWAWWPGPIYQPVAYCPGFVAFFGFGNFSFGFSFGYSNVAWVPLAPYEPFRPWWGGNVTNINITNINITNVNITKYYRNARGPHEAIAALTVRDFQNGLGRHHYLPVNASQLRNVALVTRKLSITPTQANMRVGKDPAHFVRPVPISPHFHSIATLPQQRTTPAFRRTLGIAARKPLGWGALNPKATTTAGAVSRRVPQTAWDRFASARGMQTNHTSSFDAPSHNLMPHSSPMRTTLVRHAGFATRPVTNFATTSHPALEHTAPSSAWSRFNSFRPHARTQFESNAPMQSRNYKTNGRLPSRTVRSVNGPVFAQPRAFAPAYSGVPSNVTHAVREQSSPWARFNGTYNDHYSAMPSRSYPANGSNFNRFPSYGGSRAQFSRMPSRAPSRHQPHKRAR